MDSTRILIKAERARALPRRLRIARTACTTLNVRTELVQAIRGTCTQTFRLVDRITDLKRHNGECTRAAQAGDVSCFSNLFRSIARTARVAGTRQRAINTELRRRGIGGACGSELGGSRKDDRLARAVTHDAFAAAHAIERHDQPALQRAAARLDVDFARDTGSSAVRSLRRIRACPH